MKDRRRALRRRLGSAMLFAALLLCCSVVPVLAETPPGDPSSGAETASSEQRGDDPRLRPPTGPDISLGIQEAERREIEREEWLGGPEATRERELSRTAYAALASADAEALVKDVFADYLAALDSDPARFLSGAQLVRPLGLDETAAVVKEDGEGSLMDATIPVRTEDESGDLAKVDLSLEPVGDGWETANALTDVVLPKSADGPLGIGDEGVSVTQVDAEGGQSGRLLEGESVYYHEALPDIGTIAAPVAGGVEVFNVLYSEESAERLEFDLDLPAGTELRADGFGGAEVVRDGEIAGYIRFPTAVDAQGSQVPSELHLDGDTVILDVEHRGADFAYPILVDPEFVWENWYTANWWNGYGLAALTDGTWSPYASVPWIYVQTTPYYATFGGSNRGLFLSGASGNWDANRFGQWTYTVPDWDSYIDHSSLLPFWRDDHGCGYTTYKEPHDYVGHWDGTQWIGPVKINEARTLGYSNLGMWGKQLVIGIGSGAGGYNPCVRDVYVGGVGVWLDDWSQPALWTYPTAEWMDATPNRQNVVAQDIGLGVRRFDVEATDKWGGPRTWQTWHGCIGTRASRCPEWWNLGESSQPKLNFDPSVLPEGIVKMNVTAYDAVLRKSTTTNTITVRIDHTAPEIKLSGTITEQATLGTEKPKYTVRVDAKDGEPLDDNGPSNDPTKDRSGVISISQWVDGKKVNEYAPGCPTQNCSHFDEGAIEAAAYSNGKHTLTVKATDKLGHVASQSLDFYLGDTQAPSLSVTGLPAESMEMPTQALHWKTFGANGAGDGQLKQPAGVAIDAQGDIWVADKGNNRIQKFTSSGQFLAKFGSTGSGNGQLSSPASIAIDPKGDIWVADKGNGRVQKFNAKGEYLAQFGSKGAGNGQFTNGGPEGIAIDAKGNIWVSDTYAGRVQKFDENGTFLKVIGSKGTAPGQLGEPTGIDVAPNGNVWVADWQNNRVSVFNEAGEFVKQFGSAGSGDGQFNRPDAIAIGSRGDVWVGDQNNGRIQEFDQNGTYLGKFGSPGSGAGQFNFTYPMGVATDSKGSVWIADTNNHRIQRWLAPSTTVTGYLESLNVTTTDAGYGMGSIAVKLTDETGATEVLGQTNQSCGAGGCSLDYPLDDLDLSGKPSGTYLLSVLATDVAGNVRETSRVFNIDSSSPEIELAGELAESAGQPLTAASAELEIDASDSDPGSEGVGQINVERNGQLVASYPSECSEDCNEVEATYAFQAPADGAARSIERVATAGNGASGELRRVSCVAASDCWAVGRTKPTFQEQIQEGKVVEQLLERWNGSEWQATTVPKPEGATSVTLEDVSCAAANACLAIGSYSNGTVQPLVEIWNGASWTAGTGPLPAGATKGSLHGVSCVAGECWVYGKTQVTFAEQQEGKTVTQFFSRWSGSAWQTTVAPKPEGATSVTLEDISCASASSCLAVGSFSNGTVQPLVEIWNGASWTAGSGSLPPSATKGSLSGVSCGTAGDCWTIGKTQISFAEQMEGKAAVPFFSRWNGSGWQVEEIAKAPEGSPSTVTSLSCASAAACTAVGRYSNPYGETLPLAFTWDAAGWRFQPMPIKAEATNSSLESVFCTAANECASVGYSRVSTTSPWQVLAEAEAPDGGPHEITVEAIDVQGNAASETIQIDVDPSAAAPAECNNEPDMEAAQGVLTPTQAIDSVEESLPLAVAPTDGAVTPSTEELVDPTYSQPSPNLETVDSLATGETSVEPEGGFTVGNDVCIAPASLTPAATDATVVSGDAALFANTAPETDMVIRPTAMGATVIHSLRGPNAPDEFAWNVTVAPGQELVELPSGAVAIVEPSSEAEEVAQVPAEPEKSAADIVDVEAQVRNGEYELINAADETQLEVVAVISRPWVVLAQGGIVPALIEVAPVIETPNEFEVIVRLPENAEEAAVWPVQVITDMAGASSVNGNCSVNESPCGWLDLNKMAQYAVYWGNEDHHYARNPFYVDYKENDCTNFISQILRAGGGKFMRAFEKGDGSWWYRNLSSGGIFGDGPTAGAEHTQSWGLADLLPRHLWRFGLAHIDPKQQPHGWTKGNIIAYDWIDSDGKGNINHLNFVVGTNDLPGGREPLIANHSSQGANYPHKRWQIVRERIDLAHSSWGRFALAAKHRGAHLNAKKHAPANLYGPNGLFNG